MFLKRPVFDSSILQRLKPLNALNNYYCFFMVLHDWLVVFGAIIVDKWLYDQSILLGVLFYPMSLMVIGGRMRALATLLHVSTHRALAKSKLLNDIMGSVFSGWCVMQSWTGYHYQHILLHHPHLGNPDKDPDFQEIIKTGLYSEGTTRADVVNYLKSIPTPRTTFYYIRYLIKDRVFPKYGKGFETILRSSFWVVLVTILYHTGNMQNFLVYWITPMFTTANWFGIISEMLEHFPLLHKGVDEIHASRNKFCGEISDYFINPHGDKYHLVHHLFPRIPHWNFKKAHDILMEDENYRAVNKSRVGLSAQLQDMMAHFD